MQKFDNSLARPAFPRYNGTEQGGDAMNSNQINCFLTAAKHLSFSQASEELFVAQSSVSRSIIQLEEEWGVPLFTRHGKRIALTPEGEEYRRLCQRYVNDFELLRQKHMALRQKAPVFLQYSVFPVWNISKLLYENAEQITRAHPGWELSLKFCPATDLVRLLLDGGVDLIFFIGSLLSEYETVEACPLLELPQSVVYSARHPLAAKPDLTIGDLKNETFLFLPDSVLTPEVIQRQVRSVERKYGFRMRAELLDSPDALPFRLESGQGVALMDIWSRYAHTPELKQLAIDLPLPIVLAWRKDRADGILTEFTRETAAFFQEKQAQILAGYPHGSF